MDTWTVLVEVAGLIGAAVVLGVLFERLRMSALSGYLLAGVVLGPGALNLVQSRELVTALAELGVSLLLFTVGLEFSWKRLRGLGAVALLGGSLQIILTAIAVFAAGLAVGLDVAVAATVGIIAAPSSTAVVLRILREGKELDSVFGRSSLGILLLQDAALLPLVLIVTTISSGGTPVQVAWGFAQAAFVLVALVAVFWLAVAVILPRFLDLTAFSGNRDLFILMAVIVCVAAMWTAHAVHVSPALGAFIAGMLLAESPYAAQIRADVGGLRAIFVTLFFVSVGMLADPAWITENWQSVAYFTAALITAKALLITILMLLFRLPLRHAVATGVGLSMVGEFSFMLIDLAAAGGLLGDEIFNLLVSATILSLFIAPFLVTVAAPLGRAVEGGLRLLGIGRRKKQGTEIDQNHLHGHVVLVGLGPAGRAAADRLRSEGIVVVGLDLNRRLVDRARKEGWEAHVGDAVHPEVLEHVHAGEAAAIVITIPDHQAARSLIQHARRSCPRVPIIARCRWDRYRAELTEAGADAVINEEELVGQMLGATVLERMI